MKKKAPSHIVDNRAARFHYEILETYQAGIVLTGPEAKACRVEKPVITNAFVSVDAHGEAWIKSLDIPPYRFAKDQPHDRKRDRKLLLTARELEQVRRALAEKGVTAVPLNLHFGHGRVKLSFGIGKGKKKFEKRETLKQRDLDRELRRGGKF